MVDAAALSLPDIFLEAGSLETRTGKKGRNQRVLKVPVINTTTRPIKIPAGVRIYDMVAAKPGPVQLDDDSEPIHMNATHERDPAKGKFDETCKALNLQQGDFEPDKWRVIQTLIWDCIDAFPDDDGAPGFSDLPAMDIKTTGPPVRSRAYKTTPEDRGFIKETVDRLLASGIIRPSQAPWAFPVLVAKHRSGKLRMCVNYKKLNERTRQDSYPLPKIDEVLSNLGGKTYFSTIDLCQGFHQIRLSDVPDAQGDSAQDKSTMVTPFGTYAWNAVGFGMTNSPGHFSRCMDMVLSGLHWTTCCVFIDDIIIFSNDFNSHVKDIRTVFQRLIASKLKVKAKKCQLFLKKLQFLGHTISAAGIEPIAVRCEAIQKIPAPKTLTQLRSFIQTCQYYRRFVKKFALIAAPLYEFTTKVAQPFLGWLPGSKADLAFQELKDALCSAPVLKMPNYGNPYFVYVDASQQGFGAVLEQDFLDEKGILRRHPVHYASRRCTPRESNLESTHREASAVVWSLHHFRYFVQGLPTTVFTDHGPLTWLMSTEFKNSPLAKYAARLQQWQPHVVIKYKPGRMHANADGPSRLPIDMTEDVEDTDDIIVPEDLYVGNVSNDDDEKHNESATIDVKCPNFKMCRGKTRVTTASNNKSKLGFPCEDCRNALHTAEAKEFDKNPITQFTNSLRGLDAKSTRPSWEKAFFHQTGQSEFLKRVSRGQKSELACRQIYQWLTNSDSKNVTYDAADLVALQEKAKNMVVKEGLLFRVTELRRNKTSPIEKIAQLYIPENCRVTVLTALHEHPTSAHVGSTKMLQQVQQRYYWPNYADDVIQWATTCPLCQRYKAGRPANLGLLHPKASEGPFTTIAVDHVSGFPTWNGYSYILTIIDQFTRWCWFVPVKDETAETAAKVVYENVLMDHGMPNRILSDRGSAFTSKIWERVCQRFGIKKALITTRHAQSNANVERLHRHYPKALAILSRLRKDWPLYCKEVQFAYRTQSVSRVGYSPFEMLYGRSPVLPLDLFLSDGFEERVDKERYNLTFPSRMKQMWQTVTDCNEANAEANKLAHDKEHKERSYPVGTKVLLWRQINEEGPQKLSTPWNGPYIVEGTVHTSERTYRLRDEETGAKFVSDVTNLYPFQAQRRPLYLNAESDQPEAEFTPEGEIMGDIPDREMPPFNNLSATAQMEVVRKAIEQINRVNPKLKIAKSVIPNISSRYPWGVFAKIDIDSDTHVAEYLGEKVSHEEKLKRYPLDDGRYVFDCEDGSFLDGSDPMLSGVARFINSTGPDEEKDANCQVSSDGGRLYIRTIKYIHAGSELNYHYGDSYEWDEGEHKSLYRKPLVTRSRPEKKTISQNLQTPPTSYTDEQPVEIDQPVKIDESKGSLQYGMGSFNIEQLGENSMILYDDIKSPDAKGWSMAMVEAIDVDLNRIEGQRYGSYKYDRKPEMLETASWLPRYVDPKDNKDVYVPPTRHTNFAPVIEWIEVKDVFAHGFYLTNKTARIPKIVLQSTKLRLGLL
jgi:transposase InsO family protein